MSSLFERPYEPEPVTAIIDEPVRARRSARRRGACGRPAAAGKRIVTLRIRRYNPEIDDKPHWHDYEVEVLPTERVLDALNKVKWEQDGTLTYRRSCAHGICGSDAMRINGRNQLACKTLINHLDMEKAITIEAIKGLPLEKDLIVDMEPFFQAYRDVQPLPCYRWARANERAQAVTRGSRTL